MTKQKAKKVVQPETKNVHALFVQVDAILGTLAEHFEFSGLKEWAKILDEAAEEISEIGQTLEELSGPVEMLDSATWGTAA